MIKGWSVTLPKDQDPVFEDRCIGCARPQPSALLSLQADPLWGFAVIADTVGINITRTIRAPACRRCRHNFLWRKRGLRIGGILLFIPLLILFQFLAVQLGLTSRIWAALGAFLTVVILGVILNELWPPIIEITAYRHTAEYEFRNARIAHSFGEHNHANAEPPAAAPRRDQ